VQAPVPARPAREDHRVRVRLLVACRPARPAAADFRAPRIPVLVPGLMRELSCFELTGGWPEG
jgi:hypothetical protein